MFGFDQAADTDRRSGSDAAFGSDSALGSDGVSGAGAVGSFSADASTRHVGALQPPPVAGPPGSWPWGDSSAAQVRGQGWADPAAVPGTGRRAEPGTGRATDPVGVQPVTLGRSRSWSGRPTRRQFLLGAAAVVAGGGAVGVLSRFSAPALPSVLRLATGPKGAVFVEVGGDIADAVHGYAPQTRVTVQMTSATVENLRRLSLGTSDLGFASLDAAALDAHIRTQAITALGRIYDSCLHLVVPARSRVESLRDLTGLRVGVGAAASGTEFTSLRLMEAAGVQPAQAVRLSQAAAMQALGAGSVDAVFSLTGYPTPAIAELARKQPLRLIALAEYAGLLERAIPRAYAPAPIPAGVYQGVGAVDTVLVPNVLLARPGLSDVAVALMMNALYGEASRQYWVHPDSRRISLGLAMITGPVLLHPVAQTWLNHHPA